VLAPHSCQKRTGLDDPEAPFARWIGCRAGRVRGISQKILVRVEEMPFANKSL